MRYLGKIILIGLTLLSVHSLLGQDFGEQQVVSNMVSYQNYVHAADLDGDGDADVLSTSFGEINWHENLGGGRFGNQQTITTSIAGGSSLYAIDLNSDDKIDVLSASRNDNKIAWYENLGGGNFGNQNIITTAANGAKSVYSIDLDEDGDADVLSASLSDDKIAWYENLGGGNFGSQNIITEIAGGAYYVFAIDLDLDGDNDVLSASSVDDKIAWYENLGNGNFGNQNVISTAANFAHGVYSVDLDLDGDYDVLSMSYDDDKIAWYENLGNGSFGNQQIIAADADGVESLYSVDLDSDNDFDVLYASVIEDKIAWYENLGDGNFGDQKVITTIAEDVVSIYAVDLDNDNDFDILSALRSASKIAWHENLIGERIVTCKVYYDKNENGLINQDEHGLANIEFNYIPEQFTRFTNQIGEAVLPLYTNSDTVFLNHTGNWNATSNTTIIISDIDTSVIDTIYFGLFPNQLINDATLNITSSLPRCNTEVPFQIVLTNTGTTILEGTLETTNIDLIDYVNGSAFPTPDNIINEQLSWNFDDLYPGESFTIDLNFLIDGPEAIGDAACLNALVTILTESTEETTYNPPASTGETDLVNICHCTGSGINPYVVLELPYSAVDGQGNYDHANHGCDIIPITDLNSDGTIDELDCLFQQTSYTETTFLGSYKSEIRCSFDPNDKAANPAGESNENWTLMGQDIIYTIRFQNTGNDTAFQVELIDTLSEHLYVSTFDFITSSHRPVDITIESIPNQEEKVLKFLFEDILLPDSTTDQVGSNGFVQFSIRPKFGLPDSTILTNDVGIYFDLNPPVITNLVDHNLVYTIPDYRAPEAVCKTSLEIFLDENGNATISADQLDLASTDNVGIESIELDQTTFTCTNLGNNSIQLTVFDAVGNSDVCESIVIVKDEIEPTVTCEDIMLTIQQGESITLTPEEVTTTLIDNCSIQSSILSQATFSPSNVGSNVIDLTVTDASGNQTICPLNVEITVVSNVLESQYGIEATIAPNPFSDFTVLNFNKPVPFNFDVKVVNITGKVVQEFLNLDQQKIVIENENWASGIYMLNVFEVGEGDVLGSYKLIVE